MKKILVVEDSATVRLLLKMYLRSLREVTLSEACDGVEAMEKINEADYDLIITDINMPRMDGLQLIENIRMTGLKTPILILTTRGEEGDREKGIRLGANNYITKPVIGPELANVVMDYVNVAA